MRYLSLLALLIAAASASGWNRSVPPAPLPHISVLEINERSWGLPKIHAKEAWDLNPGRNRVVVAVIDTGIDAAHPFLKGQVSKFGYDFVKHTDKVEDDHGHGTHIAGIIESVSQNRALVVPLRYYAESNPGSLNLANTVQAINFAVDHGARVINYSGGGPEFSETEYLALKRAEKKGVLVVAAAGNERQDTDKIEHYYYPAAYRLSNIVVVAATDRTDNLIPSSNWGKNRVDVTAPGDGIYSSLPGKRAGQMSGTSQATAFVTGIAVTLLADNPKLTPRQVIDVIKATVDYFPQLNDKVASGRVNAEAALKMSRSLGFTNPKKVLYNEK